jgi:type VI protein secretion system component VasF
MGRTTEMDEVRADISRIFSEMKENASSDLELLAQYEKVELPLIFFTDFMIKESNLPFAYDWVELGRERNELAGDEKFFDLLDAELADPSDSAAQRLVIFYTCLGLGFTGVYTGQLESIQRMISQISGRISGLMDADKKSYICPEAYENVDTRDFVEPPGAKLIGIGITLIALIIIWAVAYCCLFKWTSDDLTESLDMITGPQKVSSDVE